MKRSISLLLALILALSLAIPVFAADKAEDGTLTRGEFVIALFDSSGSDKTDPTQDRFDDVPAVGALAQAVRWAAESGIIDGYGDGRFGPDDPMTREQMVTMLYRYANALGQAPKGEWMFPLGSRDADTVSDWAEKAMQWAVMQRGYS